MNNEKLSRPLRPLWIAGLLLAVWGCTSVTNVNRDQPDDRDLDGLPNSLETLIGTDADNPDSDSDGLQDGDELEAGTSPLDADSDGDGIEDGDDPALDTPTSRTGSGSSGNDVEPNDSLEEAVELPNIGETSLVFQGRIDLVRDVDVFRFGELSPGDRVVVDFDRVDEQFYPAIAILDDDQRVFMTAQDPFLSGAPQLIRLIDERIRHGPTDYFLAITHREADASLGSYRFDVLIERGLPLPTPTRQELFLDFDGGTLDRSLLGVRRTGPFEGRAISRLYRDDTDVIKASIVSTVIDRFAGFDVIVTTSDDPDGAADGCSVLLFGSFSDVAFGVSQGVDTYNLDRCDDGIIFTESFTPFVFGLVPSPKALGAAIGNVAAHEAGHLLGLQHVTDPTALMDEASPAIVLLTEQVFKTAPLAASVFPLGHQDAPLLLAETVGER